MEVPSWRLRPQRGWGGVEGLRVRGVCDLVGWQVWFGTVKIKRLKLRKMCTDSDFWFFFAIWDDWMTILLLKLSDARFWNLRYLKTLKLDQSSSIPILLVANSHHPYWRTVWFVQVGIEVPTCPTYRRWVAMLCCFGNSLQIDPFPDRWCTEINSSKGKGWSDKQVLVFAWNNNWIETTGFEIPEHTEYTVYTFFHGSTFSGVWW